MNKKDFQSFLAKKYQISEKEAERATSMVLDTLSEVLTSETEVKFTGFGKFRTVETPERNVFNPNTRQTMTVSAKKSVKFSSGEKLKKAVNQ